METTKFKTGDRVYCGFFKQWGEVIDIVIKSQFPIKIKFDGKENVSVFYANGSFFRGFPPSLSFTEYTIEFKGFSQERPIDLPENRRVRVFWDDGSDVARYAKLESIENQPNYKYFTHKGTGYQNISKTPPKFD